MGMGIYAIHNLVNDKMYIGSAKNLITRKKNHIDKLNSIVHPNRHLQAAYNKYGKEFFLFKILEEVADVKSLINREQYWIDLALSEETGLYNKRLIAESNLGMRFGPETSKKHSLNMKGRILKTHCVNGHINIPENRYKGTTGGNLCRLCRVKDPNKHYPLKTCKRGHMRIPENLYKNKTCKICQKGA